MTYDTNIIIKTDSKTKNETQEIFEALGLDKGEKFYGPFDNVEDLMRDLNA